jgi:hypothetical protein
MSGKGINFIVEFLRRFVAIAMMHDVKSIAATGEGG